MNAVYDWETCPEYATPPDPITAIYAQAARVRALFPRTETAISA